VNQRIDERTEASLAFHSHAPPWAIRRRLGELDREWNVDRVLMANFAVVGGAMFLLGVRRAVGGRRLGRRPSWNGFLTGFSVQLAFLLNHAVLGWCPPASVARRLGFRTQREILAERALLERLLPRSRG
jgi:hypothetical protein